MSTAYRSISVSGTSARDCAALVPATDRFDADDPSPPRGKITGHRADMLIRSEYPHGQDGLEEDDPGGAGGIPKRQRARGLEGDVGGVHRVRFAVHQADPEIDERMAGGHSEVELAPHALLHRRDELAGDRAADDLVDELPPGTGRERLHLDMADCVLSMSTRLLDVAAGASGRSA